MPDALATCAPSGDGCRARLLVQFITVCAMVGTTSLFAVEPATPPRPVWNFVDVDCGLTIRSRTMLAATNRTPAAEALELRAGTGSQAFATYELQQQVPIITELTLRLQIKSDRPGLQLHARAVLPRSEKHAGPRTVLLPGPKYTNVGEWQSLKMDDLNTLLEQYVRISRASTGEALDSREAFIDLIAVNVYGGRGQTQVALTIPDVDGAIVQRSQVEAELASATRLPTPENHAVSASDGVLTIDGRPFAPRIIRPRGENWSFLKQLGFNTIWLATPPSAEQMATAEQLDLWLIAPVPRLRNYAVLNSHMYRRVVAWDLEYRRANSAGSQQLADQIRDACGTQGKPLLAHTTLAVNNRDATQASQFVNILVHERPTLGTTLPLAEYGQWFQERSSGCLTGSTHWAQFSTHVDSRIQDQINAFQAASERETHAHEPRQLWQAGVMALAHGARAICLADETRLDGDDEQSQLRAAAAKKLNLQQRLLAAWLVSGRSSRIQSTDHAGLKLATLHTDRATLAIPIHSSQDDQFCAGEIARQPVELTVTGGSDAATVFLVRSGGLEKITSRRVAGGTRFDVDDLTTIMAILLTSDDRIAGNLSAKIRRTARQTIENEQLIARLLLNGCHQVQLAIKHTAELDRSDSLHRIEALLAKTDSALKTGHLDAAEVQVAQSLESLYRARRKLWQSQTRDTRPATCPLATSFVALPALRRWQGLNPLVARGVNLLHGSSFEDLETLIHQGWVTDRIPDQRVETQISLTEQGRQGRCLRMAADGVTTNGAEPIAWVHSAPLALAEGQQVRIDGWLKVKPSAGTGNRTAAAVFDSWAGPQLAHRIAASSTWQPFTLYRIGTGQPLTVTCALTGPGELLVDDLLVSPLSATSFAGR